MEVRPAILILLGVLSATIAPLSMGTTTTNTAFATCNRNGTYNLCGSGPDYGSEGSNGDFTCVNPVQPGPGCPNDQSSSSQSHWQIGHDDACNTGQIAPGHHSQDYMNGFNQGLIDCRNEGSGSGGGPSSAGPSPRAGSTSSNGEPAHCDVAGYSSCYTIGFSAGQAHPGTSCPSGHSQNYCTGWNAGSHSVCTGNCAGVPAIPSTSHDIGYNDGTAAAQTDITNCNFVRTQPSGHHTTDYKSGYTTGYWDEIDRDKNDDGTLGNNGCVAPPNPR